MNKTKIICSLLVLIFTISPLMASADGVVIRPLPEGDWTWADEGSQQAFINYENGIEKLIVAVDIEQGNFDAVWIMPVPGNPEQVGIDVLSELPIFFGSEVMSKAKIALYQEGVFHALGLSQVWTLPFSFAILGSLTSASRSKGGGFVSGPEQADNLISVSRHIEKQGMIVELITAKTGEALYNYLTAKGLKIEQGSISVLESYIEKDYVFVVSWISPVLTPTEKMQRGIFIIFPTPKIYYPLIPTSAYGEKEIPITIRILGHVKPKLFPQIRAYTDIEYFTDRLEFWGGGARCKSDMNQLRTQLELYYIDHNRYPSSLEEFSQDSNFTDRIEVLKKDMEEYCGAGFNYSGGVDSYYMYLWEGRGELFIIDSEGRAEEILASEMESLFSLEMEEFYMGSEPWKGNADYTKININAPARLLEQDLWMKQGRPLKISLALSVINFSDNYPMAFNIFLYLVFAIILSWLAGGIAGLICFREFKKYALIGLANVATLIGFIIALRVARRRGVIAVSKKPITLVFSLIFLGLTALAWFWMKSLVG